MSWLPTLITKEELTMMQTVTVIKSNLSVEVLKSNLRGLVVRLVEAQESKDRKLEREIYADMTYYEGILYDKLSTDEFIKFQMELDELR